MKKTTKIISAAVCAGVMALAMAGCTVKDPNPYTFTNKPHPVAETDAGMNIDGKLDEERWTDENLRWLNGVDKPNSKQYADIIFTTSYGSKGVYFAMKVEEHGTSIFVNPDRASWLNSCIEMYMGPANDEADSSRLFEFDFMADGSYQSKLNYNGWIGAQTTYERMPIIASVPLGGAVNTPECYGYNIEAFFPWTFLEFCGYDVKNEEEQNALVLGIDPVHIFSYNYAGTDEHADRLWSQWSKNYKQIEWLNPSTFFRFGKEGLISHKIIVNKTGAGRGTVAEKSGLDYVLSGVDTTFVVKTVNGASVKKLVVNGVDYIAAGKLTQISGEYRFVVEKPLQDIVIDIEID